MALPARPLESHDASSALPGATQASRIPGRQPHRVGAVAAIPATTRTPVAGTTHAHKQQPTQPRLPFSDARNRGAAPRSQRRTKAWLAKLSDSTEGAAALHAPADVAELRARRGQKCGGERRGPPQWSVEFAPLPGQAMGSNSDMAYCSDGDQENVSPAAGSVKGFDADVERGAAEPEQTHASPRTEPGTPTGAALSPLGHSPPQCSPAAPLDGAAAEPAPAAPRGRSSPAFVQPSTLQPASTHTLARAQPGGVTRELARRTAAVKAAAPTLAASSPVLRSATAAAAATCATSYAPHERIYGELPKLPDASAVATSVAAAASRAADTRRAQALRGLRTDVLPPAMADLWMPRDRGEEVRACVSRRMPCAEAANCRGRGVQAVPAQPNADHGCSCAVRSIAPRVQDWCFEIQEDPGPLCAEELAAGLVGLVLQ